MIGLVVNPVAGLGGSVGLKGTDGMVEQARALGAIPHAHERAALALRQLPPELPIACAGGDMGETSLRLAGREPAVVVGATVDGLHSTAADTRSAVTALVAAGAELILFAGGDGTARDVCSALGDSVAALGIPAGVKIQSATFAQSPRAAGELAAAWHSGRRRERVAEVVDLDDGGLAHGRVGPRLYGTLRVPLGPGLVAGTKSPSNDEDQATVQGIADRMAERTRKSTLLLGCGTTLAAVGTALGLQTSLLGIDLVRNGEIVVYDGSEAELLAALDDDGADSIVTPIGGQGFILGRGNQQLSPAVLRRAGLKRLTVLATPAKLAALGGRPLLVDTGDDETDSALRGWHRLVTGYDEETIYRVE
jgi:predicted polyphosphate/ATP-dependent NAD kinase